MRCGCGRRWRRGGEADGETTARAVGGGRGQGKSGAAAGLSSSLAAGVRTSGADGVVVDM